MFLIIMNAGITQPCCNFKTQGLTGYAELSASSEHSLFFLPKCSKIEALLTR